ncbi:YciI family protein [soil metagenome]
MQFMCLIHIDERVFDRMSVAERDAMVNAALDSDARLRASGAYAGSAALEDVAAAKSVRVRKRKLSVTDGPFAETREQLGGFVMIEAADIDAAVRIAATIPMATIGTIEVRPVRTLARIPAK